MLHVIFRKFLTLLCLISIGFLSSCATTPAVDESTGNDDVASDSQDTGDNEVDGEDADNNDTAADTTDGESNATDDNVTDDSATADESVETETTPTETACSFLNTYSSSTSGTNIGTGLPTDYEPSDAIWHTRMDQLFLVSDEGWISMMASDGSDITSWYVGGDLEGITVVDPESSFIYIGVENPDGILEFNMDTETVTRTFTLTTWMTGADNQGLEALTFVPDASQTEGGQFYAGHQGEGSVYVFELPIATSTISTSVTYVTSFTPVSGRTDIAGLSYNTTDDVIYIAYDGANKLRAIETDGTLVTEWTLPGNDQEGLAIDEDCHLYITEDDATHDVWVYP